MRRPWLGEALFFVFIWLILLHLISKIGNRAIANEIPIHMPFSRSIETGALQTAGSLKKEMPMSTISGHDLLKLICNKHHAKEKGPLSHCGGRRILPSDIASKETMHVTFSNVPCLRDATNRAGQTPLFQMTKWHVILSG